MDDPKPEIRYDNYKEFSLDELLPEPNCLWVGVDKVEHIRPKPEDNLLRAILNWKVTRTASLAHLLGYSPRTVTEGIAVLQKRNLIRGLGHLYGAMKVLLAGIYYEKGDNSLRERMPLTVAPKKKSQEDPSAKDETINRNFDRNVYFTGGRLAARHVQMVFESVAWYMKRLNDQGLATIAYPESVLRFAMGWYSVKNEKKQKDKVFLTEVPDAWIVVDGGGIRVEVQLSSDDTEEIKRRCEAAPHGEAVLYIFDRKDLYDRYRPLQDTIPNLMVARFNDEDTFKDTFIKYLKMVADKTIKSWPLRNHYGKRGFAYCVVNPIEPNFSGNREPKVRAFLEVHNSDVNLQRQIYQPGQTLP